MKEKILRYGITALAAFFVGALVGVALRGKRVEIVPGAERVDTLRTVTNENETLRIVVRKTDSAAVRDLEVALREKDNLIQRMTAREVELTTKWRAALDSATAAKLKLMATIAEVRVDRGRVSVLSELSGDRAHRLVGRVYTSRWELKGGAEPKLKRTGLLPFDLGLLVEGGITTPVDSFAPKPVVFAGLQAKRGVVGYRLGYKQEWGEPIGRLDARVILDWRW